MKVEGILMDRQDRRDKLIGKVHFVRQLDGPYAIQHFQMVLPTESQEAATAMRYRQ